MVVTVLSIAANLYIKCISELKKNQGTIKEGITKTVILYKSPISSKAFML